MDTRKLERFLAIYQSGTLSGAAETKHVAVSALSRDLSELEQNLGTRLFHRKPRGLEPTAAGQRLSEHATIILRAIAQAESDVRQAGGSIAGDVSVGLAHSATKAIGAQFVRQVLNDYPQVKLSLTESVSGASLINLMTTEMDLALIFNPPKDPRLRSVMILEEQLGCVGSPTLLGNNSTGITFDEVLEFPLILLGHGASARATVDDTRLLKKLEARARLRLNSVEAIGSSLINGLGVVVGTELFMRQHIDKGALVFRPIINPGMSRSLHLCQLAGRAPSFALEAIGELLVDLTKEAVRSNEWKATLSQDASKPLS